MKKILSLILVLSIFSANCPKASANTFPLEKALSQLDKLPKLKHYDYSKEYFKLVFASPVSGYRYAVHNKDKSVYHKHRRKRKTPYSLKEEDLAEIDFWSYKKPAVTVLIVPQPQTKNIVKLGRWLGYATALSFTIATLGIGMFTLTLPGKISGYKVSKDFMEMNIEDSKSKEHLCSTSQSDIRLMNNIAQQYYFPDDHYEDFHNKLFLGIFEFKPECFMHEKKTKLIIRDKKGKKVLKFKIPKKLKESIRTDFQLATEKEPK